MLISSLNMQNINWPLAEMDSTEKTGLETVEKSLVVTIIRLL